MAAAALQLIPAYVTSADINTYLQILFGFAVIGVGLQARHPASVPVPLRRFLDRLGGRKPEDVAPATPAVVAKAVSAIPAGRIPDAATVNDHAGWERARDRRTHRAVRRSGCSRRPEPAGATWPHHRIDRSERCGQDHHVQRVLWTRAADTRPHHAARP